MTSDLSSDVYDVAIVGTGHCGVALADAIRERSPHARLIFVERDIARLGGGLAFGAADMVHRTNTFAGTMYMTPGSDDFYNWCVANRRPDQPKNREVHRLDFGAFLKSRLWSIVDSSVPAPIRIGTVVGVDHRDDGVRLSLSVGNRIRAKKLVLATGNCLPKTLPCLDLLTADPLAARFYVPDQWSARGKEAMARFNRQAPVAIIGTALSAYDAALSLRFYGHRGEILMISRGGHTHIPYDEDAYVARKPVTSRPRFAAIAERGGSAEEVVAAAREEFRELTGLDVDVQSGDVVQVPQAEGGLRMSSEDVLAAWQRDIVQAIRYRLGLAGLGALSDAYGSLFTTLRVGVARSVHEDIAADKGIRVLRGGILGAELVRDHIRVDFRRHGSGEVSSIEAGGVVSSMGTEIDCTKVAQRDPLWSELIEKGWARVHATGIGIRASSLSQDFGSLGAYGAPNIFVVGAATVGNRHELRMAGPVALSVPGMRADVRRTAAAIVRALDM